MDRAVREKLINLYAAGYEAVTAALAGITDEEMEAREGPNEWTPRQICHHLGDSEMNASHRFHSIYAMDNPVISGYDQAAFAQSPQYQGPVESALQAFRYAREVTLPLLRAMTDEDWQRTGIHSESGPITAETLLTWYGPHAHDHADQIRRARVTVAVS